MGFAGEGNKFNTGKRNEVRKKKGYHSPLVLEIIIRYLPILGHDRFLFLGI